MNFRREERFLLLTPEYIWGGAETQFRYLIVYAEKHKKKLDVIIEHRFKEEDPNLKKDAERMKTVRFFELDEYEAYSEKFVKDTIVHILKNIFKVKYKACLIHYTPDLAVAPFLRLLGIKVIYSERNDASVLENDSYYRRCLKFCKGITANSQYAQKALEELTGRKVIFIRNGKPVLESLEMKEHREIQNILVPCRVFPVKNQMMVLQFLRENKSFTGKVIFAGRIEDKAYFRKLLRFIETNHLQNRAEFVGQVADMKELYQATDLVVLPSLLEGTPNVVLEAYLYHRPVIVSESKTVKGVVRDPRMRFPLRGTQGIDKCMNYIQSLSDEEYRLMLKKNREYVLGKYNVEKMTESYFRLLG